jgi:SRSO17 transposase
MDFIVNESDPVCDSFFENFAGLWSRPNQREAFRAYVLGLISETHRKNIEAMSDKIIQQEYQSLHHFIADAPWDDEELNRSRLALLMSNRRTAPRASGVLVIDDSGVPKKGNATEAVKRQYIGQLGKTANGQVFVTSHYADKRCHWPVDILPYKPDVCFENGKDDSEFKTKVVLALELADKAVELEILFRALIADKWYGRSPDFINGLDERELPYIVDLPHDKRIFVRLPDDIASTEHRLKDVLCIIKPEDFRPVRLKSADGTEREVFVAGLRIKIKKIPGKRRVVVATGRPDDPAADKELRFLVTNVDNLRNGTVAELFARRNWIEVFYREAKDDLGANEYQVRDLSSIMRHWRIVFAAYSLLVLLKRNGCLARWCKKNSAPCERP